MRIWRWFTSRVSSTQEEDKELKLEVLRSLLPGVSSAIISDTLRGLSTEMSSDPYLQAIFEESLESEAMLILIKNLKTQLIGQSERERQVTIWRELEAESSASFLREEVMERFHNSEYMKKLFEHYQAFGVAREILTLPLMCLPSVAEVEFHFQLSGERLLSHRQLVFEAIFQRDCYLGYERARHMSTLMDSPPLPLFSTLTHAVMTYVWQCWQQQTSVAQPSEAAPSHLNRLILALRRGVVAAPHNLYALYAAETVESWADSVYSSRDLIPQELLNRPEQKIISLHREALPQAEPMLSPLSALAQLAEDGPNRVTKEAIGLEVTEKIEAEVKLETEAEVKLETEVVDELETTNEVEIEAHHIAEEKKDFPSLDPAWALERTLSPESLDLTEIEFDSLVRTDRSPLSSELMTQWKSGAARLVRGELSSLWSRLWSGHRFSAVPVRFQNFLEADGLESLSKVLDHQGVPLFREQLIDLLSDLGLRLPRVWELQVLYAAGSLDSFSAFWTRDSRIHLWSPSEGAWRSQTQNMSVAVTAFWDESTYDEEELDDLALEILDADSLLESLASSRVQTFDFGLSDLLLETEEIHDIEPSHNESDFIAQSQEEVRPELELAPTPELELAPIPELEVSRDLELKPKVVSATETPSEQDSITMLLSVLPYAYEAILREQSVEICSTLIFVRNERRVLRKSVHEALNTSMVRISLGLHKLGQDLQQAGLPQLVQSKFETTRTAPVSGSYLIWVGP